MNPNPFSGLAHSRKFWLLILDVIVSTLTLVLSTFLVPEQADFPLKLIAIYQPAFITIITMVTVEDGQNRKLETAKVEQATYNAPTNLVDSTGSVVATVQNPQQLKTNL